ncbi:GIY-YIG nuclease family protein [Patescibacteria group bacterium]|nr:GIY-YIG nuclease family protein [Patescibacteria group bacterium]MCL5409826.1 GIY-YIG nuclease family protein [Patescibacteria group bacterium]
MYTVYVLKNRLSDKIYSGQTADLEKRINQYNSDDLRITLILSQIKVSGSWYIRNSSLLNRKPYEEK